MMKMWRRKNSKKGRVKEKIRNFRMPRLSAGQRFLLYVVTILFIVLSLLGAGLEYFPYAVRIVIYVAAMCLLSAAVFYLVSDIKNGMIVSIKKKIERNVYLRKLKENDRLRMILSAVPGTAGNIIFALMNGGIGLISHSAWFGSLAAYYILLSIMRVRIVWQERKFVKLDQQERMKNEIRIYRKNSVLFLFMTIVLAGMVILLVHSQGGKEYPGFTIYAAALYMFYKMTASIVHLVRERKRKSPMLMILRKVGYIDACVSMLTLQTAMFAAFGGERWFVRYMNGISGTAVCLMILGFGIQGIYRFGKMRKGEKEIGTHIGSGR